MSPAGLSLVILLCGVIDYTSADAIHLLFVNNASCSVVIDEVNQFDSYQLNYDGHALVPGCKLGFTGKSFIASEARDKYTVCVKAFRYAVTDLNFKMKYSSSNRHGPVEEHCLYRPAMFCAAEGETLYIGLSATTTSSSSFQLTVTAEKTYTYHEENVYLVYSVMCGLSFLCILVSAVIIMVVCKKHSQL